MRSAAIFLFFDSLHSRRALLAQLGDALAAAFPPPSDDVNLPGFPMAVLHNLCCGTTTVLPDATLRSEMTRDPWKSAFKEGLKES